MKKYAFLSVLFLLLISCNQKSETEVLKESSGKINHLSVIIENKLWNGEVGDSIRRKFAAPVDGLPQEEPLFTIKQYEPQLFEGFMTNSRNILVVLKKEESGFDLRKNEFAQPQNVAHISGSNVEQLVTLIERHADEVIKEFKKTEIIENQRRIAKSVLDDGNH